MMKNWMRAALLLAGGIAMSASAGTVYYVNALGGNDAHPGTSGKAAWKSLEHVNKQVFAPGDRILFRSGSRYTGALKPRGSGSPAEPIVIDRYGEGSLPRIDGKGKVPATVFLHNVEGWELRNLEITNRGDQPAQGRRGVHILNEELETARHFVLDGLFVHDVNGSIPKSQQAGVAILAEVKGEKPLRFDGVLIENCHVKDSARDAIRLYGIYQRDRWFPCVNVVIRNNLIEGVGGDGIVPSGCDGALVEYNVMRDGPRLGKKAGAAAGIWPWSCDNTVIQFNEVSDHKAWVDAQGFDSDYNCSNTVIQYNYSHDNEGGFLLICCPGRTSHNRDTIIRCNVSINDGLRVDQNNKGFFSPTFHISGLVKNSRILNNIIVIPKKPDSRIDRSIVCMDNWKGPWPVDTLFENNIFAVAGSADFEFGKDKGTVFRNNLYHGDIAHKPDDEGDVVTDLKGMRSVWAKDLDGFTAIRDFMSDKKVPPMGRNVLDRFFAR